MLTKGIEECRCTSIIQKFGLCDLVLYVLYKRRRTIGPVLISTAFNFRSVAQSHPALTMVNSGQGEFECAICHRQYAARKLWPATVTDSTCQIFQCADREP